MYINEKVLPTRKLNLTIAVVSTTTKPSLNPSMKTYNTRWNQNGRISNVIIFDIILWCIGYEDTCCSRLFILL